MNKVKKSKIKKEKSTTIICEKCSVKIKVIGRIEIIQNLNFYVGKVENLEFGCPCGEILVLSGDVIKLRKIRK